MRHVYVMHFCTWETEEKENEKPYFPMFVDLSGRQVTVVGGGSVALRRSETLLYFGVDIKVIAPEIRSEFYRLDSEGKVVLCNREYQEGDAKGADLVIAASNCREVNRRVYEECQKHIFRSTRQTTESCVTLFSVCRIGRRYCHRTKFHRSRSEESERSEKDY